MVPAATTSTRAVDRKATTLAAQLILRTQLTMCSIGTRFWVRSRSASDAIWVCNASACRLALCLSYTAFVVSIHAIEACFCPGNDFDARSLALSASLHIDLIAASFALMNLHLGPPGRPRHEAGFDRRHRPRRSALRTAHPLALSPLYMAYRAGRHRGGSHAAPAADGRLPASRHWELACMSAETGLRRCTTYGYLNDHARGTNMIGREVKVTTILRRSRSRTTS